MIGRCCLYKKWILTKSKLWVYSKDGLKLVLVNVEFKREGKTAVNVIFKSKGLLYLGRDGLNIIYRLNIIDNFLFAH